MARGYQPDQVAEYAAKVELAAAVRRWYDMENELRHTIRRQLDQGVRADVIAESLEMSRSTLFRWLRSDFR